MRMKVITTALAVTAAALTAACSSSGGSGSLAGQAVTSHNPSVAQVAQANGLTGARECTKGALYVTADGIAYSGKVKYGIDIFATTRGRDAWLDTARSLGGFPDTYRQGGTWVLYRAEDQSPGCGANG